MYEYDTQLFLKSGGGRDGVTWFESDDRVLDETMFSSASDAFKITTSIKAAKIWMGNENSFIRFKVRNIVRVR